MRLIQQPNNSTCMQACLSMLTGKSITFFTSKLGVGGLPAQAFPRGLELTGVLWNKLVYPDIFADGNYGITVPSLNSDGLHKICVQVCDGEWRVLDPNNGRSGKKFYGHESDGGESIKAWCEVYLVADL